MFQKIFSLFNKSMPAGGSNDTIHATFIDVNTGSAFAQTNIPPAQLPKSFEAHTTMHISGEDWEVIQAVPITSEEFIKSGELILTLSKMNVSTLPPGDLLFSLPTISNEIPMISENSSKIRKKTFELREDDWRQIDILPVSMMDCIVINIDAIKSIYQKSSVELGEGLLAFKEIHTRVGMDDPFENNRIVLAEIIREFENFSQFDGISLDGITGIVEEGFAYDIGNGLVLYGQTKDNLIKNLSLQYHNIDHFYKVMDDLLNRLKKFDVCIVNWCRAELFTYNNPV
jgi:hypothetical protein